MLQDFELQLKDTNAAVQEGKRQENTKRQEKTEAAVGEEAGSGGAPTPAQNKAFRLVLDQRIKDVACTIDQVVKDFACSLEGERDQRQESDQMVSAVTGDMSKCKAHLVIVDDDLKGLRQQIRALQNNATLNSAKGAVQSGRSDITHPPWADYKDDVIKYETPGELGVRISAIERQVQDVSGRLTAVDESCTSLAAHQETDCEASQMMVQVVGHLEAALAESDAAKSHQVDELKEELAGIRQHDYVFRHELLAPRARALEEVLEQRVNEVAGNFQLEQKEAILAMQTSVGRLESLACKASQASETPPADGATFVEGWLQAARSSQEYLHRSSSIAQDPGR